jgi:hypothetical protein
VIEMVRRFLRQKLDNPAIAVTLGALALMSSFPLALTGAGLKPTTFVALVVIAAGSVSKDASSGALQMILVRPLRRTDYLFGRYLGILTAFGIFLLATILLGILISSTIFSRPACPGRSAHLPDPCPRPRGLVSQRDALLRSHGLLFDVSSGLRRRRGRLPRARFPFGVRSARHRSAETVDDQGLSHHR